MMKKIKLFRISFLLPLLALAGCNEQDTKKMVQMAYYRKNDRQSNFKQKANIRLSNV